MKIKKNKYLTQIINEVEKKINTGEIIAFPTETVYGIGGDATKKKTIKKIFKIKKRPSFNPLIIHISSIQEAKKHGEFSKNALETIKDFWPGPLTLIVKKKHTSTISKWANANLKTIALRIPSNPKAQKILKKTKKPIAAPSANKSGYISATKAQHVFNDLPKIKIINEKKCKGGIESTIIDASKKYKKPKILRYGLVSCKFLEKYWKKNNYLNNKKHQIKKIQSPGQVIRHYAPKNKTELNIQKPNEIEDFFIAFGKKYKKYHLNLSTKESLIEATNNLFDFLRFADSQIKKLKLTKISIAPITKKGLGYSINEKLKKATQKDYKQKTKTRT